MMILNLFVRRPERNVHESLHSKPVNPSQWRRPLRRGQVMKSLIKRMAVAAPAATTVASLALLLFGSTSAIAVIVVDPNATPCVATYSAHYTTIQAAVTA